MVKAQTGFKPLEHGFRFVNYFEFRFPIKYALPFTGNVDLNDIVFGLCGGMCFSALDYFYTNQTPPIDEHPDKINGKLFTYLCQRQLDSLSIQVVLKILDWMLNEDRVIASRMTRYEIPKLLRMLDKGQPAVLCLIRVQGLNNPTRNHQVIATGYEVDLATGDLIISLYDPNYPGRETTLLVRQSKGVEGRILEQSSGEQNRGFFIIPYKVRRTPPKPAPDIDGISFALTQPEAGFRLHWPVDSRIVNQFFGENPDLYRPFKLPGHEGLDLYGLTGANVYACADGEVFQSEHPNGHPYGLQIRIRHQHGGQVYHTIYAHLAQSFVRNGQKVQAGQRIGLVDNTGNSFGSHLHLTLKLEGAETPGYPKGIVDPWPYLQNAVPPIDEPPPTSSGITVYTVAQLNLRDKPTTNAQVLTILPAGEALVVLGEAESVKKKIGQMEQWLQVQTASGLSGYVAAWYVQDTQQQAFPPSGIVVYPYDTLNMRSGPGTGFSIVANLTASDPLSALGDADSIRSQVGKNNEWLQVQNQAGMRGFVAAWLVHMTGQTPPPSGLSVQPIGILNVRARPGIDGNVLTNVTPADLLLVLGDKDQAQGAIGKEGQWLLVRTPAKFTGYVAAWLVKLAESGLPPVDPGVPGKLHVIPTADINLRAQPSANSPRIGGAFRNELLEIIEADLDLAAAKIGKQDMWIYVQKQDKSRGWAAAWLLSRKA